MIFECACYSLVFRFFRFRRVNFFFIRVLCVFLLCVFYLLFVCD